VNKIKLIGNARGKELYKTDLPAPQSLQQTLVHDAWLKDKYRKRLDATQKDTTEAKATSPRVDSATPVALPKPTNVKPKAAQPRKITPAGEPAVTTAKSDKNEKVEDLISMDSRPPPLTKSLTAPPSFSHVDSLDSGGMKASIMSLYTTPIAPAKAPVAIFPIIPTPPAAKAYPAPNYNVNLNFNPQVNQYYNPGIAVIPAVPVKPNYDVRVGTPYGVPSYPYGYVVPPNANPSVNYPTTSPVVPRVTPQNIPINPNSSPRIPSQNDLSLL